MKIICFFFSGKVKKIHFFKSWHTGILSQGHSTMNNYKTIGLGCPQTVLFYGSMYPATPHPRQFGFAKGSGPGENI